MKKKYRQIYVEITNICNLSCSFCASTTRDKQYMSFDNFTKIIDQVCLLTDQVYFHVLGEPFLHPQLFDFIQYATNKGLMVNITTNGTLLKNNLDRIYQSKIRKLNVSLHAHDSATLITEILNCCDQINQHTDTTIIYRLWIDHNQENLLNQLAHHYQQPISLEFNQNGIRIKDHIRVMFAHTFTWPVNGANTTKEGYCLGLRKQLAILVDGSVVPCCLDNNGELLLGNCLSQPLNQIINNEKAKAIYQGFSNHRAIEQLCQKCEYKNRFIV